MKRLYKLYKKFGGEKLIFEYLKVGFFHKAIILVLLLGVSNKGLEILRLSADLQIYKYIKKKYYKFLHSLKLPNEIEHIQSNKVWVCWLQGINNSTPLLVRRCIQSMRDKLNNEEVIILTDDNYQNYVSLPEYIITKYNTGVISKTHFTDILRIELLLKYGGTWIDATVLCTGNIPQYIKESDLFLFQNLKPGRDGDAVALSTWFISAKTNNRVLKATQMLLYEYWKRNDKLIDYFLIHNFLRMALEEYPEEEKKIIKFPNSTPHILLLDIFEPFVKDKWDAIRQMTSIHKLTYKLSDEDASKKGTYYDYIINKNII